MVGHGTRPRSPVRRKAGGGFDPPEDDGELHQLFAVIHIA
jgi:hypothetical protein